MKLEQLLRGGLKMENNNEKHFGLRVDGETLAKFRYVYSYVRRSANSQNI